jgi:hypothetical protein
MAWFPACHETWSVLHDASWVNQNHPNCSSTFLSAYVTIYLTNQLTYYLSAYLCNCFPISTVALCSFYGHLQRSCKNAPVCFAMSLCVYPHVTFGQLLEIFVETDAGDVWSGAFTATMYNKIFSGYQPLQMVKRRKNQRFEDHIRPRPQGTEVAGVPIRVIYIGRTRVSVFMSR